MKRETITAADEDTTACVTHPDVPHKGAKAEATQRRCRTSAVDARKAIFRATSELMSEDDAGLISVDQIADRAGFHKMTIYRNFGSRDGLFERYGDWLREAECANWDEVQESSLLKPYNQLSRFFMDLDERLRTNSSASLKLYKLDFLFGPQVPSVRRIFQKHQKELRSLFVRLSTLSFADDVESLTDTLLLLWRGVISASSNALVQVETPLPVLVEQTLKRYGCR